MLARILRLATETMKDPHHLEISKLFDFVTQRVKMCRMQKAFRTYSIPHSIIINVQKAYPLLPHNCGASFTDPLLVEASFQSLK